MTAGSGQVFFFLRLLNSFDMRSLSLFSSIHFFCPFQRIHFFLPDIWQAFPLPPPSLQGGTLLWDARFSCIVGYAALRVFFLSRAESNCTPRLPYSSFSSCTSFYFIRRRSLARTPRLSRCGSLSPRNDSELAKGAPVTRLLQQSGPGSSLRSISAW